MGRRKSVLRTVLAQGIENISSAERKKERKRKKNENN